ncbi:MAG: DUF333 domain-containing protein [Candidatus Parcubacteria bacterium]|nr:DUF333 domain-containing protein [Candidatus Parcubacteria bacterium]
MKSKTASKLSILLNILLILFFVVYFCVPFSPGGVWAKAFSPLCSVINAFQGDDYLPGWCTLKVMIKEDNVKETETEKVNINENKDANSNVNTNVNTQIANPASVKCQADGGKSENYQTTGGEAGLCVFSDQSICDEWAYFRGECLKGKCFKECRLIGTRSEGWYNTCDNVLIRYEDCAQDPAKENITSTNITSTKDLTVTMPVADQQLSSPIQIEGRAKATDNKVYVRVKSASGQPLINISGSVKNVGSDGYGDFSLKVSYEFSTTKEGFVEVFLMDGQTEKDLVSVPVKF